MNLPRLNEWIVFYTLIRKEILRFLTVSIQTIVAPTISTSLFLFVFGVSGRLKNGLEFVIPGLVLMGALNNAFQNTSSAIFFSRYIGNIVELLVMPIRPSLFVLAFVLASVVRALIIGLAVWVVSILFVGLPWPHPGFSLFVLVLGSACFAQMGIIVALYSETWDRIAVYGNFLIMPLIFLGGVFYPLHSLPPNWQIVTRFNPVFHFIDAFRFGALGINESSILDSVLIGLGILIFFSAWAYRCFSTGHKLKN